MIPRICITTIDSNNSDKEISSSSVLSASDISSKRSRINRGKMLISASGIASEKNQSNGSAVNSSDAVSAAEQSPTKSTIWSPFGKSSVSPLKTYKPVTFSPLSSSASASTSSQSSNAGTPIKSSHTWWSAPPASVPQSTTSKTKAIPVNGVEVMVANGGHRNEPTTIASTGGVVSSEPVSVVPVSTVESRPHLSSSVSTAKSAKISSSAVIWKPPSVSDSSSKSPDVSKPDSKVSTSVLNWRPVPVSNSSGKPATFPKPNLGRATTTTIGSAAQSNDATNSLSVPVVVNKSKLSPAFSCKVPAALPAVLDCVNLPASSAQNPNTPAMSISISSRPRSLSDKTVPPVSPRTRIGSAQSLPTDLIDLHSPEEGAKMSASVHKREPIDTTIFEKELTEDWWNSVLDNSPKDDALSDAVDEMFADEVAAVGADRRSATPLSNTAAVLRLSSSLGGAIQNASEADAEEDAAAKRRTEPPPKTMMKTMKTRGGQQNSSGGDIIQEWRSGFYRDAKNDCQKIHQEYDHHAKENFKDQQSKPVSRIAPDPKQAEAVDGGTGEDGKTGAGEPANPEMKEKSSSFSGPIPVKFDGIGPTDEKTGVPIATRVSIDEKNRKDWYRQMYASLHKPERGSKSAHPDMNETDARSPTPSETDQRSYYGPHAKYQSQRYRNQPLRIEDYKPGYHSSITHQDRKLDQSRFFESDAEIDYRNGDFESTTEQEDHGGGKTGKSRKRGALSAGARSNSFNRKQFDEESRQRKQEIEAVVAEERRRRFTEEQKQNEARRHRDSYTLVQKKSVLFDRFSDYEVGGSSEVQRPKQIKAMKLRGKAKALYPFKAQNNTELSFKKGDIIYLLRKVDKNWYRGEHNGIVGIIPVAYVEVITSLEEAELMALQREGKALAKFDFTPNSQAELALKKGEAVMLIRKVDQNWYEGHIGSRKGIFPIAFVETIQEPDTPLVTPSPSAAPTPLPGILVALSPTSSVHSGGPEVPSAPVSPWNSDFYESEFESELRDIHSKSHTRRRNRNKSDSLTVDSKPTAGETRWKPGSYFTLPSMTKSSASNEFQSKTNENQSKMQPQKDLFALASKRRADSENVLEVGSTSLVEDGEKSVPEQRKTVSRGGKSLSFDLPDDPQKFSKEVSSVYSRYVVVYDYKPKNADELELKEGEFVRVLEKCEDGWYVGFSERSNEFGTFPGNYVQLDS